MSWPWHTITRTPGGRKWIYISICLVWTSSVFTKNTIHLINFLSSQNPFGLHISSMSGIEKRYWREELESHAQDDPHKDGHRKHWEVQHPLCVISVSAPRWGRGGGSLRWLTWGVDHFWQSVCYWLPWNAWIFKEKTSISLKFHRSLPNQDILTCYSFQ